VREAGAARLGFSFVRDVPKGAAAVRELVAVGALGARGASLRVLDVGAGLGATTWGLVRALAASGASTRVDATWVDDDAGALALAMAIVKARGRQDGVELRATAAPRSLGALADLGRFDAVLVGQVLSELDVGADDDARVRKHAALLGGWLEHLVTPAGVLVVVEPALRDRTRHLHRVRDALAAAGASVFAPCLHAAPCPALARETDWCHEDLDVDLPAWLAPVARAAGLRHEGLTFAYLVLRTSGAVLASALPAPAGGARLRVVSGPMPSKGKREAFVCGELASGGAASGETATGDAPALVPGRTRAMRLDRDASPANEAWDRVARGDIVTVQPALDLERPRIGRNTAVTAVSLSGDSETR
jgi:SAM-dependent methyltransferase